MVAGFINNGLVVRAAFGFVEASCLYWVLAAPYRVFGECVVGAGFIGKYFFAQAAAEGVVGKVETLFIFPLKKWQGN